MFQPLHKTIIGTIRRLPLPVARLAFRAYDKMLRMQGVEHLGTTRFGARIHCDPVDLIQRIILHFGVWEPDVSKVITDRLAPGDVFVDIGANIGYDALLASSRVGVRGIVVAIEASPRTFTLLKRNLAVNAFASNVRAVNLAVSDRPGTLDLYEINSQNIGAATTLASRGGLHMASVESQPLEQILTGEEIARVRLIKMDVEGAEPPILSQLLERLADYPATMEIVVEATPEDDRASWQDVFERMQAAGFSAWAIDNGYELEWYLRWRRPGALKRVETVPVRQQDLLFRRA